MEAINSTLADFSRLIQSIEKCRFRPLGGKSKHKVRTRGPIVQHISDSSWDYEVHFHDFTDIYNTKVFMDNFQRPALRDSKLTTYVTLEDVKDVVMFTSSIDIPKDFVLLFLSEESDRMLRSLLLYMQYFLTIFRVVIKRREVMNVTKLRHPISVFVETLWKETLSDLRYLVAREYCALLVGINDTCQFHHYDHGRKMSRRSRDVMLYQLLMEYGRRVVEVVLLEKDNPLVGEEIDRMFQVGGPKVDRKKKYGLTQFDLDILEHNFVIPLLLSTSPISKEFVRSGRNQYLKAVGEPGSRLPRDAPEYYLAIEMSLMGAESRFGDANLQLGLLGFERREFDCFLNIVQKKRTDNLSYPTVCSFRAVDRLTDKSVLLTGPVGLLPKRDDTPNYSFLDMYLGRCENYDETHMAIRTKRWTAFRRAKSRMNYEPTEILVETRSQPEDDNADELSKMKQSKCRNLPEVRAEPKFKKTLPTFFFSSKMTADSEDDIYSLFHAGFHNDNLKKGVNKI